MPQFRQYDTSGQKTKEEALLSPISQTLQTLPALYAAHRTQMMEQQLKQAQLAAALKQLGTGEPAPMTPEQVNPGSITPGVGGPEEQLLGAGASNISVTPPQPIPQTKEQELKRVGSIDYTALHKEKQYTVPKYDTKGNQIGWETLEEGLTPFRVGGGQGRNQKKVVIGLDPTSMRPVYRDNSDGGLKYSDSGEPYSGAQLRQITEKVLPAEAVERSAQFQALKEQANEVIRLTKDTAVIGPLAGNWNKGLSYVSSTPEFTQIDSRLGQLIETAYALSGKQISEKELKMLKESFWGDVKDPKVNFDIKMQNYVEWLTRKQGLRDEYLKEAGYRVPGKREGKEEQVDMEWDDVQQKLVPVKK